MNKGATGGQLPGVECARRRRVYQSIETPCPAIRNVSLARRSSFRLYAANANNDKTATLSLVINQQRSNLKRAPYVDGKLVEAARVAKERLDERLRTQRKSPPQRVNNKDGTLRSGSLDDGRSGMIVRGLQREVHGSKKSATTTTTKTGSGKFSWAKFTLRSSDPDECAVCRFRPGETLVHLSCAHRFHSGFLGALFHNG